MAKYLFTEEDGVIIEEEYDPRNRLDNGIIIELLKNAFDVYPNELIESTNEDGDIYQLKIKNIKGLDEYYICAKWTTPGGRSEALNDEHRIQPKAKYINYINNKNSENHKAIILGIYKRNNTIIFCAWDSKKSEAKDETPISKQIKIKTISEAMITGFSKQISHNNTTVYAFKKEFLYFYLENYSSLHDSSINNLNNKIKSVDISYSFSRNRIFYGAPGTGKSFKLNEEKDILLSKGGDYERVTFHPDYSYAHFVGTYKPISIKDNETNSDSIAYKFVPGPFLRIYVKAITNPENNYLLLIEEINRSNTAAVFGDVFQLLDRNNLNISEYPINSSQDIKNYLNESVHLDVAYCDKLAIPSNMYIWATMNSADQGVFPLDTAFKRRWEFEYFSVNNNENDIEGLYVNLGDGEYRKRVEWNTLRKAINNELLSYNVPEDKLIGTYFISLQKIIEKGEINNNKFIDIFINKVLMYLFEDAAKRKRSLLFSGCQITSNFILFSSIRNKFIEKGILIFNDNIIREL